MQDNGGECVETSPKSGPLPVSLHGADSKLDVGLCVINSTMLTDEMKYSVLQHPWRPPLGFTFPCTIQKKQRRYFKAHWLDRYSWLAYSKVLGGALCRVCVLFAPEFSGKGGHQKAEQFVSKACSNWKDFHELCKLHVQCKYHETAVELASNFEKNTQIQHPTL